jgi:predicted Rossmann fold flavoprotein
MTPTVPALVPLILEDRFFHKQLMGLSQDVELTTRVAGRIVDQRSGSLLWTHFGVSGPVVMDASRFWTLAQVRAVPVEVRCSFVPGLREAEARQDLIERIAARPKLTVARLLTQLFSERFADALCRFCHVEPGTPAGQLRRSSRVALSQALTTMILPVRDQRGWNFAEVTAGGVPLGEVDFRTMESKLIPGLHLIGELLDCDGRIGGFNFQWAWSTGYLAGRAAAAGLQGCQGRERPVQWRAIRAARA